MEREEERERGREVVRERRTSGEMYRGREEEWIERERGRNGERDNVYPWNFSFFSFIGNAVNPAKDIMVVRPSPTKM